ncbi:MAG: TolB family protein, partial [Thermoguttaceae bacterium]
MRWKCLAIVLGGLAAAMGAEPSQGQDDPVDFRAVVEADWARQEQRRGRSIEDGAAVRDALAAALRLHGALTEEFDLLDLQSDRTALARLAAKAAAVEVMEPAERGRLYNQVRWTGRQLALKNPLVAGRPIAFIKCRRFVCQMLHEYIGYYYNYDGLHGGGVCVLEEPGYSLKTRDLTAGRLPQGNYTTPALSTDGRTIYFAFTPLTQLQRAHPSTGSHRGMPAAKDVPDELNYYTNNRQCFHIYSIGTDGGNLRQLTDRCDDDFNPCPMPDGSVIFMSSRRGGFCRCDNPYEPIPTTTLHTMDADGSNQKILSYHETNEWHPAPLNDGRIAYCRWDYVDRSAAHYHGIWACSPDGSNPLALFGNYTQRVSACFQPRAVP